MKKERKNGGIVGGERWGPTLSSFHDTTNAHLEGYGICPLSLYGCYCIESSGAVEASCVMRFTNRQSSSSSSISVP